MWRFTADKIVLVALSNRNRQSCVGKDLTMLNITTSFFDLTSVCTTDVYYSCCACNDAILCLYHFL